MLSNQEGGGRQWKDSKSTPKSSKKSTDRKDVQDLDPEIRMDNVDIHNSSYSLVRNKVRPFLNGMGVSISFDLKLSEVILEYDLELVDLQGILTDVFTEILDILRANAQSKSLVRIVIFQDELDSPLVIPLTTLGRLHPSIILEKIEHLSQSKRGVKAQVTRDKG